MITPKVAEEPKIDVGILTGDIFNFTLNSAYSLNGEQELAAGKYQVVLQSEGILLNDKTYSGIDLIPLDKENSWFELEDVLIGKNFHWERHEHQRFLGELLFLSDGSEMVAINRIETERYLCSVISSEMSATSSLELLKAHAVISRSWVMAQLVQHNKVEKESRPECGTVTEDEICRWYDREDHTLFHVCADDHCQRYQGITRIFNDVVIQAVKETRGEVLSLNGRICDARFSKCCGGVSEQFEECWEPVHHPYLKSIQDVPGGESLIDLSIEKNADKFIRNSSIPHFCNTADEKTLKQVLVNYDQETTQFYRWKISYSQEELSTLIYKRSGINFGRINALIPVNRGHSGRISRLKIIGENETMIVGKELEIRRILSNSHLYSSAFVVDTEGLDDEEYPLKFTFTGAGWGHGVGLCQIGAAVMADKGYNYLQILNHYYTEAEITHHYL